ncbi:DMT family transporter [Staphylococcus canis]|uniref:DMT family transporter n=1 Tax=Staphylococcus canis TaxID=2724942 RepID=A0ABS0T8Q7_9STAP|nr:DMT family transporter [Staphylococcus canis]
MLLLYFALGLCAGFAVPVQTSINSRLSLYTQSSIYASAISFSTGTFCLILVNLILNPGLFAPSYITQVQFNYTWFLGGLLGVIFLSGNLILLPRIGASLTVITTISGQIAMGVIIDTFGLFNAPIQPFSFIKGIGLLVLLLGILMMNMNRHTLSQQHSNGTSFWLILGIIMGFAPPIQTAINTQLSHTVHSPFFASFISFFVGTIILFILTATIHKKFKIHKNHEIRGPIQWWYFIGGLLGVIFVTTNIILAPLIGVTYTIIIIMIGQILMGLLIDQFGLLGIPPRKISKQRIIGFILVILAIVMIQLN